MAKTAKQVLESLTGRTNINNDNNDNNDNNLITSIIVLPSSSNDCSNPMSSTSQLASSSSTTLVPEELVLPQSGNGRPARRIGDLPLNWQSVKLDLFQNGLTKSGKQSLTLKMGIIVRGQTEPVALTAQMNSPIRHIYRGVPKEDLLDPHWQMAKEYDRVNRRTIKDLRGSKFYLNMKSGSVENLVAWLYNESNYWCLTLIKSGEMYEFLIEDEGSPAFRKNNGVATSYYGEVNRARRWVSQKELGI